MVKGGLELDLLGKQHAVTKDVAAHVTDTDDGKGFALGVATHFAEVAFDGFPGTACCDAHLLVVVTD